LLQRTAPLAGAKVFDVVIHRCVCAGGGAHVCIAYLQCARVRCFDLRAYRKLVVLRLDDNKLSSIPAEFANLHELTLLSLQKNQLIFVPVGLVGLVKLKEIGLDDHVAKDRECAVTIDRIAVSVHSNLILAPSAQFMLWFAWLELLRVLSSLTELL
jgi:Leucine-rich repeat (LRR) protein